MGAFQLDKKFKIFAVFEFASTASYSWVGEFDLQIDKANNMFKAAVTHEPTNQGTMKIKKGQTTTFVITASITHPFADFKFAVTQPFGYTVSHRALPPKLEQVVPIYSLMCPVARH